MDDPKSGNKLSSYPTGACSFDDEDAKDEEAAVVTL